MLRWNKTNGFRPGSHSGVSCLVQVIIIHSFSSSNNFVFKINSKQEFITEKFQQKVTIESQFEKAVKMCFKVQFTWRISQPLLYNLESLHFHIHPKSGWNKTFMLAKMSFWLSKTKKITSTLIHRVRNQSCFQ